MGIVDRIHVLVGRSRGIRDAVCEARRGPPRTCNMWPSCGCNHSSCGRVWGNEEGILQRWHVVPLCHLQRHSYIRTSYFNNRTTLPTRRSSNILGHDSCTYQSWWKNTASPQAAYPQVLTASGRLKSITAPKLISPHPKPTPVTTNANRSDLELALSKPNIHSLALSNAEHKRHAQPDRPGSGRPNAWHAMAAGSTTFLNGTGARQLRGTPSTEMRDIPVLDPHLRPMEAQK